MSADFCAGHVSGAVGIAIGNPLDILKTRLQAGGQIPVGFKPVSTGTEQVHIRRTSIWTAWLRGAAAPILGYGALNALLFVTYNRSLALLNTTGSSEWPGRPSAWSLWTAGACGGLATFFVSAPTELVKCRAQVSGQSSLDVTKALWSHGRVRGLYTGGAVTSARDAVGYGFYFWSYEMAKRTLTDEDDSPNQQALKVLLCGGLAGVATWVSIFPLDVIKTRVQTWDLVSKGQASCIPDAAHQPLLGSQHQLAALKLSVRPGTLAITREAYTAEGFSVFFRGLGICSARAFIVNAVQWAVYEYLMKRLA